VAREVVHHHDVPGAEERLSLRAWLRDDGIVDDLRRRGLWTDPYVRVAEFAPFLRAQEHSAQIAHESLTKYEVGFKAGPVNILKMLDHDGASTSAMSESS
jgi:hypothetical protein